MVAILRGPATVETFVIFSRDGDATVGESGHRFDAEKALTITGVIVSAGVAPVGADLVVDVLLDDTTSLWDDPADRPRVVDGTNVGATSMVDHPAVAAGHYLAVGIVGVGTTTPGSKIDVRITYR